MERPTSQTTGDPAPPAHPTLKTRVGEALGVLAWSYGIVAPMQGPLPPRPARPSPADGAQPAGSATTKRLLA